MLYLIALYCFITLLCAWAGLVFYSLIDPLLTSQLTRNTTTSSTTDSGYRRPVFLYLVSGLIFLTALAQWWVIFLPITPAAIIAICLILTLLTWIKRRTLIPSGAFSRTMPSVLFGCCFLALLFMILTLNAGPTIMDDTDSYHIQMVKWIQQYGSVPGIANLHLRFGFNSSWFTSIGLLSPNIRGVNQYLALNGLLSCWFCHYLLQKIFAAFSKNNTSSPANRLIACCAILAITLLCWPMVRGNAATANYDFITTCCIIALFMESSFSGRPGPEWIVWPLFLFTVRVLNAPLLLLTAFMLFRSSLRTSFVWLLAGAILIVPFIIRNTILSGYPLFPIWQLDPFSFDWKVSKPLVREIAEFIKYYNRSNDDAKLVIDKPFTSWIAVWYRNLYTYDRILIDLSLVAWAGLLISVKRWLRTSPPLLRWITPVMLIQLIVWLWAAPDPRFVYSILLFPVFTFLTFIPPLSLHRILPGFFLVSVTCLVLIYTVRKTVIDPDYRNWLLPHTLPTPLTKTIVVDGILLRIPEKVLNNWNPRCFDLQLPCLYMPNPYLRARGSDIRNGFRVEPADSVQKIEGEYKIR